MQGQLIHQELKIRIFKVTRWVFLCWVWMFTSIILSPLFRSDDQLSSLALPLAILYIAIFILPYLLKSIPNWLLVAGQALLLIWVGSLMTESARMVFLMMGVPIVLFEELVVINNWRRVPIISLMYICFILYSFGRVIARLMILSEAMVAILLITYVAYISLYRRLEQNETIRQTNLKLSIANQKIADLTADKVRQAVARELHDTLTQDVVGINMQLSAIKMLADQREYTKMNQMLDQTEVMATEAIKHSRDLIKQYRENENHHQKESLKVVSQTIVDRFAEEYGLQTEFMMDRDVSVASEELHDMGRVLNEALMNVVKHGQTNTATVKITVDYGLVTMVVTNQGRFLKRPQVKNGHYGLQNMKERVEKYGGRLTFHPVSKNGVEVIATFLIEEEQ